MNGRPVWKISIISIMAFLSAALAGCQHLRWSPEAIQGVWVSPCLPARAEIGFSQASVDETQIFTATEVQIRQRNYTDAACRDPYFSRTVLATFSVGDAILDPIGARKLELAEAKVLVRVEAAKAASDLSQQFYCGRDDWALGVDKDVAGLTCNGVKTPAAGAVVHQIAQVDEDTLYLGSASSGDGSTPDKRPTVLSKTPYQRVR